MLLAVLKARGFEVGEQVRVLISSCRDVDQLELWITRAATSPTIDDVFAGPLIAKDAARHWAPVVVGWSLT